MRPRIAIPVPTSNNADYNDRNWIAYADAVQACGGEPVKVDLDLTPRQIAELANTCQAILLPGSPADVTPEKFSQEKEEATAPADLPRENVDELLLHNLYKPILGICFGAQILNVWRSGTLVQDLAILPVNHSAARGVAVAHAAVIAQGSLLSSVLEEVLPTFQTPAGQGLARLPINSSHHQAIGIPGDGLHVSARCPQDGVVEAIEGGQANSLHAASSTTPSHFVLGVQWHPERTFVSDPASQAIFQRFVQEATVWSPRPILTSVAS
jgi:putative glutamine amidotransferase